METVNVASFMQVIGATQEDDRGLIFPSCYMPDNKPVRSDGVTKQMLMTDKGIAEGWYESIRSTYERLNSEADTIGSIEDVPTIIGGGEDPKAGEYGAVARGQKTTVQTIKEKLQEELKTAEVELEAMDASYDALVTNITECRELIFAVKDALEALTGEEVVDAGE